MTDDSTDTADQKPIGRAPQARSRITNGRELLHGVDGRGVWPRRMRDLLESHLADIGGIEATSEAQRQALRRIAVLEVECEFLETAFAERKATGKQYDLYLRSVGVLKRLYELIGLERRARDVTPDLRDYLAAKRNGDSDG